MRKLLFLALLAVAGPAFAQYGGGSGGGSGGGLSSVSTDATLTGNGTSGTPLSIGQAVTTGSSPSFVGETLSGITGSTQCLQVNTSGVVAGSGGSCGGSASPGTPTNSVQYNSASSFAGDSLFLIQPSSAGVYQPIQLSSNTTVGLDTGHCGALLNIGTAGTRCSQAGNNFTNQPVLIHNNGGVQVTLADQSDSDEADMTVNSTGARFGTNISAIATSVTSGVDVPRVRAGGSGNVTVGLVAAQDAGTNAGLYINYPSTAAVGGMMFASSASTQTAANTNEIVLYSFSIPAGTLKNAGDCLEFVCGGSGAATATTKEMRIRFGGTTLSSIDGTSVADAGAVTANNVSFFTEARVCKNASNVQKLVKTFAQNAGTTATQPASPSLTKTDTSAIIVSCTCQNGTGNNGDCLGNGFEVEYKPAP